MDGGNSIAIKGCKFAKSAGDAGGDKKGVASGTIEAEAKFITASATVKIEGKGVCRLSDQMTMNKANTMCMGGAQNPSVTVTADEEGTYTVDLKITYSDGAGFQAKYKLIDSAGSEYEGQLDETGTASVSGVAPGLFSLEMTEDQRDYKPNSEQNNTNKNPFFNQNFNTNDLIDITKIGKPAFWEAGVNSALGIKDWIWGVIQGDFNKDPTTGQIFLNTVLGVIPGLDQAMDGRDIVANILFLSEEGNQSKQEAWLDLAISAIGAIPTIGSVMKGIGKAVTQKKSRDDLFALLRSMGKGNVDKFILELDWNNVKYEVLAIIVDSISNFNNVLNELSNYADMAGYEQYATDLLAFKDEVNIVGKKAEQYIPDSIMYFKELVEDSLKRGKSRSTTGSHKSTGSAEAGSHTEKASEDKPNKNLKECWLCEQKIAKTKSEKSATNCTKNGYKGKHYKKTEKEYGFSQRGTGGKDSNGHHTWTFLKEHNKWASASQYPHKLYARCYDKVNGKYTRTSQIWDAKLVKALTEKDKVPTVYNLNAHHLITVGELKANDFLYKKLPFLGYDINEWHNLVVLPSLPELACFYEMPLHASNHPKPYTKDIKRRLQELEQSIRESKYCGNSDYKSAGYICGVLESESESIFKNIISFKRKGALAQHFSDTYKKGGKGCCNVVNHGNISESSLPCTHRQSAKVDPSSHHDFRKGHDVNTRLDYLSSRYELILGQ